MEINQKKYLTVQQVSEYFNWPLGGLRGLLFRREENGLDKAVIKVGRKILINRTEFENWIASQAKN